MSAMLKAKAPFSNGSCYNFFLIFLLPCFLFESTTGGSTYLPLNNAKKVSYVIHDVVGGTNRKDVAGLIALHNRFSTPVLWYDDPCLGPILPSFYIKCNSDPSPRVIALNLGSQSLFGQLPDFSSMDALESIDFSGNQFLTGPVPSFLASFPNLRVLNLAYCDFSGTLPAALSSNRVLSINITGNHRLVVTPPITTAPPPPGGSSGGQLEKILGGSLSSVAIIVIAVIVSVILRRRRRPEAAAAAVAIAVGLP